MITKERLQELIKQGATIYVNNSYQTYELNMSYFVNIEIINEVLYCGVEIVPLEQLFEIKEDARVAYVEGLGEKEREIAKHISAKKYEKGMEITIKELLIWYNCIKQKIEEMQKVNYSHYEQTLDYKSEYFKEKERIHKEELENNKEYERLMKMLEQLENIVIKVNIEVFNLKDKGE